MYYYSAPVLLHHFQKNQNPNPNELNIHYTDIRGKGANMPPVFLRHTLQHLLTQFAQFLNGEH